MPLPFTGRRTLSNLDLLSFTLDNPRYDVNEPVGLPPLRGIRPEIFIDPADPTVSLSHTQSVRLIRHLVAGFRSAGLKPSETVCIHSFNNIFVPVVCLAIIGAGGVFVGVNPSYTQRELEHVLRAAQVKLVLSEPEIADPMRLAMVSSGLDIARDLFIFDHLKTSGAMALGGRSWKWLQGQGEEGWTRFNDQQRQTETTAGFFFTSGTTGLPKCAMVSHRNLVAQHQIFWEPNPRGYKISTVHVFPLYHIGAFPTVIVSQLKDGRQAYIMRRFNLEPWLSYHVKYGVTEVFMAPPMVVQAVMSGLSDPDSPNFKYSLGSVRNGYVGAAPLSADIQKRFHRLLGSGARLTQIWGMTETTSQAASVPPEVADRTLAGELDSWGSIGKPLPEIEMKLVDGKGNDTTKQGRGEAWIRGPTVVRGYFNNEKVNQQSWSRDGYFKTGDVMEINRDTDLLYVVERQKELIKVRSFQVAPAELEGVLTAHPDIADAAVIGVPDERSGELPRAYIVLRDGASVTSDEVRAYMRTQLASYKSLEGGIFFVPEIPKLPSGKILKRVIREWVEKEQRSVKL